MDVVVWMQSGSGRSGFSTTTVRRRSASGSTPPAPTSAGGARGRDGSYASRAGVDQEPGRLYRYRGAEAGGGKRRRVPILLLYGFVLKPYILDLVPGNSLVEHLVGEGFDVYLFDFGIPAPRTRGCRSRTWSWTTYRVRSRRFSKPLTPPRSASSVIPRAARCRHVRLPVSRASSQEPRPLLRAHGVRAQRPWSFRSLDACDPQQRDVL